MNFNLINTDIYNDKPLPQDLEQGFQLLKYIDIFEIFKIKDPNFIPYILAGAKTVSSNAGTFTVFDIDRLLAYMNASTRHKVFEYLKKYHWIEFNGLDFEFPLHVKSFINFLFTSFSRRDMNYGEELLAGLQEAETGSIYLDSDNFGVSYYEHVKRILIGWRDKIDRVIQKRSAIEIENITAQANSISNSINIGIELLKSKRKLLGNSRTQEIHLLLSEILRLTTQIFDCTLQLISENSRSINVGRIISPQRIDEFLESAETKVLEVLIEHNIAAPKRVLPFLQETMMIKADAFFKNKPEIDDPTPPPVPVDYEERPPEQEKVVNPLEIFYQELCAKMQDLEKAYLDELLFEVTDTFGKALYRTGQLVTLVADMQVHDERREINFDIAVAQEIKKLTIGPLEQVSEVLILKDEEAVVHGG